MTIEYDKEDLEKAFRIIHRRLLGYNTVEPKETWVVVEQVHGWINDHREKMVEMVKKADETLKTPDMEQTAVEDLLHELEIMIENIKR